MLARKMVVVCKYRSYVFTLVVLCSKLIEEGQNEIF